MKEDEIKMINQEDRLHEGADLLYTLSANPNIECPFWSPGQLSETGFKGSSERPGVWETTSPPGRGENIPEAGGHSRKGSIPRPSS